GSVVDLTAADVLYIIASGTIERTYQGKVIETLRSSDFFGEASSFFSEADLSKYSQASTVQGYTIDVKQIRNIPVVRWKLLETHLKRNLALYESGSVTETSSKK
ncbi:MAG: hypothetical protein HKP41_04945, partial [Desulfobacterales bacterium]|nr:hypothetical protein [Desulfobacterales bacterium]